MVVELRANGTIVVVDEGCVLIIVPGLVSLEK